MKNWRHNILIVLGLILINSCAGEMNEESFPEDEEEEVEELSEFREMVNESFEETSFPYDANEGFDDEAEEDFLTEKQFEMLELYMVFPEGYERKRYSAKDRIETDFGFMITVLSQDNEHELSTYLVTYDKEEWYVDHLRIAYDEIAEGFLRIYSTVNADTIVRTTSIFFDEEMLEAEEYYIEDNGDIVWEGDLQ